MNLAGNPVMVRDEGVANSHGFDWGSGSPSDTCNVFPDMFSARWTRTVNFTAAPYRFTFTDIDDGFRLKIDGQPVIDRWFDAAGTHIVDVNLGAGNRTIEFEYYEKGGLARANVSWVLSPPNPPSNLSASVSSHSQINLSWTDNSGFEDGFKIERWNGSSFSQINVVGANVTTYSDLGLAPSTLYRYRVRAYNIGGDSGYSNERSVITLPQPGSCGGVPDYTTYPASGCQSGLTVRDGRCTRSDAFIQQCDRIGKTYDDSCCCCR